MNDDKFLSECYKYKNSILDDRAYVYGQLYLITNHSNSKCYVGQTLSHRLNHGRYRPWGFLKRFQDHIWSSRSNRNSTTALHQAIKKYGESSFAVELLADCPIERLNELEIHFIEKFSTLAPNGYNLTSGGQATNFRNFEGVSQKLSQKGLEFFASPEGLLRRKVQSDRAKNQYLRKKLELFKDAEIVEGKLQRLVRYCPGNHEVKVFVHPTTSGGNKEFVRFQGKYNTKEELLQRAYNFLEQVVIQKIEDCDIAKLRETP